MCGSAATTVRTTPLTLMSRVRTSTSGGLIATVPLLPTPALASTMSMPPNAATVPATAPSIDSWLVTSASNHAARSPSSSASARSRSGSRPTSDTRAPLAAARRAVSAPMPRAAPVIITTLLSSLCLMRSPYPPGTAPYRKDGSGTFLAQGPCLTPFLQPACRGGGAGRAAGEATQLAGLFAREAIGPPAGRDEQLAALLALLGREGGPAGLQPEEDDARAAPQLRPGDLVDLREL